MRNGCHPERPVGALFILGSNDTFFPVAGDDVVLSVDSTMSFWAGQGRCAGRGSATLLPDTAGDSTHMYRTRFLDCVAHSGVQLDSIAGSGHGWPGALHPVNGVSRNLSANQEILQFVTAGRSRPR